MKKFWLFLSSKPVWPSYLTGLIAALVIATIAGASQNSLIVPDGTGASVRAGFNNAIDTLNTINSGPSAPATTEPYMLWCDTTNGLLKQRDAANATWIVLGTLGATRMGQEPAITAGTTSQFWRGDKTWQALPAAGVPLSTGTGYTTSLTVGTAANNLVQLNSSGQLPAVSGANLTNLPATTSFTSQNVVTGSRALGTIYRNTTGKTMFVTVSVNCTNYTVTALTDSSSSPSTVVASCQGSQYGSLSFMVLNNNYYEVTTAYSLQCWTEWY
jgi:hypothetical protein